MSISNLLSTDAGRLALDNVLAARDTLQGIRLQIAELQEKEKAAEEAVKAAIAACDKIPAPNAGPARTARVAVPTPVKTLTQLKDYIAPGTKIYSSVKVLDGHDVREGTFVAPNKIRFAGVLLSISGFGKLHIKDMQMAKRTNRKDTSFDWFARLKLKSGNKLVSIGAAKALKVPGAI